MKNLNVKCQSLQQVEILKAVKKARQTMRKKKERMEDNLKRMEELELQGFFCITKKLFVRWFNLYEHRDKYIIRTAEGKQRPFKVES